MKVTDQHPDFWDFEEDETWPQATAAVLVFILLIGSVFVWLFIGAAAQ